MKKALLLALMAASSQIISMEQNQEPFPWEQLLPELKGEILNQIVNAPTVAEAIQNLQNMKLVNKELYKALSNRTILFKLLNKLNQRFPGSEGLIARTLNTQLAQEWLKSVNPEVSFTIIPVTPTIFNQAIKYIRDGDLASLKKWLDKGYDPRYVQFNGWTLDSYAVQYIGSVPALELISEYNPAVLSLKNIKELLFAALRGLKITQTTLENKIKMQEMANFLTQKLKGLVSQEEASKIINDIDQKIQKQFGNVA